MSESTSYWEKVPLWNNDSPDSSFDITSDQISGRIPVTRLERWRDFTELFLVPTLPRGNAYLTHSNQRFPRMSKANRAKQGQCNTAIWGMANG